jgi:protein SCO1/2
MDFVFTTCTGPCPAMSAGMAELQDDLVGKPLRLVSVSVDPGHDTPEVLAAYAQAFDADPEQWLFLTGAEEQVVQLAASIHMTPVRAPEGQARPGEQVTHSTKLVVVDGQGLVRGYYDGTSAAGRRGAAERALHLAR